MNRVSAAGDVPQELCRLRGKFSRGGSEGTEHTLKITVTWMARMRIFYPVETNDVTAIIVDAAYRIHQDVGPGLFESVYEVVLADALAGKGLKVAR